ADNWQSLAGRAARVLSRRKLIEVGLDQNGAESAEDHDLRSRMNRIGCRPSNAREVLADAGGFQTVGRNERVDVDAARPGADNGVDVDRADCSGRNPWKE